MWRKSQPIRWRGLIIGLLGLMLAACQNVELYSSLTEREGNEILAVLLSHDIPATKTRTKDTVKITVAQNDVARAIETLRRYGYPRDQFTHLGDIFQKQGLISSPLEERVRYTFGLSQMVAETLNQIDGVLSARVLIVLPEDSQFGKAAQPSSASVFIKYLPGLGVEDAIPRIKMLVQHSVDGLEYDKISVVLFPTREAPQIAHSPAEAANATDAAWPFLPLLLGGLLILALGGNGYLFWRMRHRPVAHD
jgi:type III secretion protein J